MGCDAVHAFVRNSWKSWRVEITTRLCIPPDDTWNYWSVTVFTELPYNFIIEDNTHSQHIFECQCSFAGMITSGSNTKKKNAKHLASEYMLRSLQERGMVKGLRVPEKPFLGESDDNFDNPTSKLFEFVQIRGRFFNSSLFNRII